MRKVMSIAFSPDGQTLASGGCGHREGSDQHCTAGEVLLWDLVTGQRRGTTRFTGHTDAILSLAFSPDGKALASSSEDGTLLLWDEATGQQRDVSLTFPGEEVSSVAFSPDGAMLAAGGCERFEGILCTHGAVRLWGAVSGRPQRDVPCAAQRRGGRRGLQPGRHHPCRWHYRWLRRSRHVLGPRRRPITRRASDRPRRFRAQHRL